MKTIFAIALALSLSGCATIDSTMKEQSGAMDEPQVITKQRIPEILTVPANANEAIPIAVYSFNDKTGQRKPNDNVALLSSAVTQGAEVFLIKALKDAGGGKWFKPIERVGLDNLVKERQLIRSQRETYEGQQAKPLEPLLVAGVMIEGGIVGFDTNIASGGIGAAFLGIGADKQYRVDQVVIVMRLVSVQTGEVLLSVGTSKTIYSTVGSVNLLKFVDSGTKDVQFEAGSSINEPTTYAVRVAIEAAVVDMIREGQKAKLWFYKPVSKKK
jgi:curli production assembly/transport component CsgG